MTRSVQLHRLKWLLYLIVFLEGGLGLFLEITSAQMMAPLYGTSLTVWAGVVGVTIASLTVGYYIGGWLAQYEQPNIVFYLTLLIGLHAITLPHYADPLIYNLNHLSLTTSVLIASSIVLMPPLVLLGTLTPIIIQLFTSNVEEAGIVTGQLFALSTIGGISGAFITGFWLIPALGITQPLMISGSVLIIIVTSYFLYKRNIYPVLFLLVLIFSWTYYYVSGPDKSPNIKIHYRSEGLLGQIMVADIPHNFNTRNMNYDRMLFVNRMGQTWIDLSTGASRWPYIDYVLSTASTLPKGSDMLLLGLGGGTLANRLHENLNFNIDAVELDPRIVKAAKKYFGLDPSVNTIVDDARHYIRATDKHYDLFMFDIFKGEMPPAHALTVACFKEVKQKLRPGGLLIINFNGFIQDKVGLPGRSLLKTLQAAGFNVLVLPTQGGVMDRNVLYIAAEKRIDLTSPTLPMSMFGYNRPLTQMLYETSLIDLSNAWVLTDNRPLLEKINYEAALIWRKGYNQNFTTRFHERGIPLFR